MSELMNGLTRWLENCGEREKYYSVVLLSCDPATGDVTQERQDFNIGNAAHDSYSVAKSVTAMAAGVLFGRGLLQPADTVGKYLCEFFNADSDMAWRDLSLDHLMRHCTGAGKTVDFDLEKAGLWADSEWLHTLFSFPITGKIGADFRYSDGNYYIMSRIVEKICGTDLESFAEREILHPLGFHQNAWSRDPVGHTLGGTGLYMRTEDMAKLGLLCFLKGRLGDRQIFPASWVQAMCGEREEGNLSYGYGISMLKNGGFAACGMYGQGYYFNRRTGTVCAWHSYGTHGLSGALEELDR